MDDAIVHRSLQMIWASSHLSGSNAAYLEALYENYLKDPDSIGPEWREYFESLPGAGETEEVSHSAIREHFKQFSQHKLAYEPSQIANVSAGDVEKQVRVLQLINAYRFRGHQKAKIDPLAIKPRPKVPDLDIAHHGFSEQDLNVVFDTGSLFGQEKASLREILEILEQTYCGSIGSEYMHITDTIEKRWIQKRLESTRARPKYASETKQRLLERVTAAEGLESFLHRKYVGQKRFSLEGGESLIPLLDELIHRSGRNGVREMTIGMAHRGRLNVLINVMGKTSAELFKEFEGKNTNNSENTGDVKYHQGFSANIGTEGGLVHVALAFNPSHLEIVGPVVEGSARARQERHQDDDGDLVVPVVIHGDAAFAGQGVVMETFNMSQSRGFSTKGTVHIVVNNQIGFTTSYQKDARSTLYCTDVAKMVNAPIFHVNGDDPEAVLFVSQVALDYRMRFHKDVVIDLVCYRRHGHSEADEPSATQPLMYKRIREKETTRALYAKHLIDINVIAADEEEAMINTYRDRIEGGNSVVTEMIMNEEACYSYDAAWARFKKQLCNRQTETCIEIQKVRDLSDRLYQLPEGFVLHKNVEKIFDNRHKMAAGGLPIDWGFAENLAYASLLDNGFSIRLSGQDCGRGTFFHRHAAVHNQKNGKTYVPLRHIAKNQPNFLVVNSLLSEEAVLAFEYGYATTDPNCLTIWEAQFGDFANNAQVVIDQFISAGEQKWNRLCGLAMFLPHGYEGQGPEHSSARLERYLQLCAQNNIQVCAPTTPSQIFHLLRRQMLSMCRKPLIVMTPKSLLRHRMAVSTLEDITEGEFKQVIPDSGDVSENDVTRLILCSGKVYYDLLDKRHQLERNDVAIVRVEQLYPFPKEDLTTELLRYKNASEIVWCQEEPMNQGAWYASQHHIRAVLSSEHTLSYAGRPHLAAPAVGYPPLHIKQLHSLLREAFGLSE